MGNIRLGVPVRVIRKHPDESVYKAVYTYDGLYDVVGRSNGILRGNIAITTPMTQGFLYRECVQMRYCVVTAIAAIP